MGEGGGRETGQGDWSGEDRPSPGLDLKSFVGIMKNSRTKFITISREHNDIGGSDRKQVLMMMTTYFEIE